MRKLLIGLLGLLALTVAAVGSVSADEPQVEQASPPAASEEAFAFIASDGGITSVQVGSRLTATDVGAVRQLMAVVTSRR